MSFCTTVRYGKMHLVRRVRTDREDFRVHDRCIVRTDRGREIGEILLPLEPVPETPPPGGYADIVRRAGDEDLAHAERIESENIPHARKIFREFVERLTLKMRLVEIDYIFGGERIIFYFTSPSRVDFRELVRRIAQEFRTRIELRQVGARDETKLSGDCGHCGLSLCCRGFMRELGGIGMDMAKVQKHTADPSKITGQCGKLLCCLRFEYGCYTEARKMLPGRGKRIETTRGNGVVVEQSLLKREVVIEKEDGGRAVVKYEEITKMPEPSAQPEKKRPPKPKPQKKPPQPPPPPRKERRPVWVRIASVSEIPEGTAKKIDLEGLALAVCNAAGRINVIDDACPHQQASLGEGTLEDTTITCPQHGWKFDVASGKGLSISGSRVRRYDSQALGDDLFALV